MKIFVTLNDLFEIGFVAILLIVGAILFLIAVIDVKTKDWRYRHFKCPSCDKRKNGSCGHFRNSGCDCEYFSKRKEKLK